LAQLDLFAQSADEDATTRQAIRKLPYKFYYRFKDEEKDNGFSSLLTEAMRQDGLDRFGGKFSADRRVLYQRERFER